MDFGANLSDISNKDSFVKNLLKGKITTKIVGFPEFCNIFLTKLLFSLSRIYFIPSHRSL